jgi:hypothetical protein
MDNHSIITLTFGETAENHVGMEKIGITLGEGEGFTKRDLMKLQQKIKCETIIYKLHNDDIDEKAYIMLIKNGVEYFMGNNDIFNEQLNLDVDKKALMYGRVVNKKARWNLCFDDESKEPDYIHGKGRVISYNDVPLTKALRDTLENCIGEKASNLKCEGNYYYCRDICGIGFHGDSERRKVIGVRLGNIYESYPLHFQWYINGEPYGERLIIPLHSGDIYIMSEKAVGTDWKKKNIFTLRHATGCNKFIQIN